MLKRIIGIIIILILGLACSTNKVESQKEKIVPTSTSVPATTTTSVPATTTTSVSSATSTTSTSAPPSLPNGRPELTGLDAPDPEVVISGNSYYLICH